MTATVLPPIRAAVGPIAYRVIVPIVSILAALAVSAVLIVIAGADPLAAYGSMFQGAVGGIGSLATTAVRTTPLLLTGLAVALSFRAGIFNVGAEGQLYAGAALAALVALAPLGLPAVIHVPLTLAAGFAGGALWAFVPGWLRAYRGVSEVVTTLMLNFVGIQLVAYLVDPIEGPMGERGASYAQSHVIAESAELPILIRGTSLHAGLLLGLALAVGLYLVIRYTPIGFRLRMLGGNPLAARFAGLSERREILVVMLLSGGIAGLAGAAEVAGLRHRLYDRFSPGYGYDGIAVALLAGSNPLAVILSAAFFGGLRAGANAMQQSTGIETSVVLIIQALTILFVILGPLRGWATRRAGRSSERQVEAAPDAV